MAAPDDILVSELQSDEEVFAAAHASVNIFLQLCQIAQKDDDNPDAHVKDFVEVTVPRYSDGQFRSHFRMFPAVFELLCEWLAPHLPPERTLSVEKKVMATVWLLANKESYRSVADRFGMNKGTLHRIVVKVCRVLTSLRGDVIRWPRREELPGLAEKWKHPAGFPGVVGAVDGTYIKIPGLQGEHRDAYICRKGFPAMHLQVVCDKNLSFIHVHTGNAGSVHDSRVLRTSDLMRHLESEEGRLPPEYHLLGDSAYPLKEFLMVPFRDNGHLSDVQRNYNIVHSKARVYVEHAIGLLKGKFRRLKDLDMAKVTEVPYVIFACCVLHNFVIFHSGVDRGDIEVVPEDIDEGNREGGRDTRSSATKRQNIAELIF